MCHCLLLLLFLNSFHERSQVVIGFLLPRREPEKILSFPISLYICHRKSHSVQIDWDIVQCAQRMNRLGAGKNAHIYTRRKLNLRSHIVNGVVNFKKEFFFLRRRLPPHT